jgi:NADH:ubiquinone reductase (H+-translocating)
VSRQRVVIVGGGFGGLACARALAGRPVEVLLIDRRDYHQFTPLLYQVASALLTAPDIAYPFRAAFRGARNVRFLHAEVAGTDLERRVVHTRGGDDIAFDYLVLATGSENNYFGNPALAANTLSMKTLPQAQRLRNHVLACLERAVRTPDEDERRHWLTFVVIGGGPTGIEFTGALLELLRLVLGRDYPELAPELAQVVLIEGTERILPAFSARLGRYARGVLERRGVEVLTGTLVERAGPGGVLLADGREIAARTVVWSAGIRATQVGGTEQLPQSRARRLATDEHLRLTGQPRVFAIGDVASVQIERRELPMLSPPAMQEGRHVARAILADVRGRQLRTPFRYHDKGTMAVIGRNAAVGSIGRAQLTGRLGWLAWLGVHIYYLIGFRNRAVVLINWAWNYLRKDRPIRMITNIERDPLADELTESESATAATPATR